MADNQQHQKKQFSVPSRDELIQQIKDLDQDIEHVTLNLIKCDFNATEKDIEKTFPEFKFIKIKNYNPGSFEVIFEMRIDAINFIRNHYDKKILNRRFFIKMGRQQKQVIENWTGVGSVPRQFRGPNKFNQNKPAGQQKGKKPQGQKTEEKTETQKTTEETKPTTETKTQVKPQVKEVHQQPKKEGKVIPKTDYHKKPQTKKPLHHQGAEKKTEGHVKKQGQHHVTKKQQPQQHATKKQQPQNPVKKEQHAPKVEKKDYHKKQEKTEHKKDDKKPKETAQKAPQVAQKKQQDDGWIVVGNKNPKKK